MLSWLLYTIFYCFSVLMEEGKMEELDTYGYKCKMMDVGSVGTAGERQEEGTDGKIDGGIERNGFKRQNGKRGKWLKHIHTWQLPSATTVYCYR